MSRVRKKTNRILLCAAALTLAAATGITVAFMFRRATAENQFVPAQVSCTVHEKLDGVEYTDGLHSGTRKTDITVENTSNIAVFIRLRVVSNWVNAAGEIIGISSKMPELSLMDNWIKGSDDAYYYLLPVEAGASTTPLCAPIYLEESTDRDGSAVYQNVELFAEVIQASPQKAATAGWGVTVSEGKITSAP